MILIRDAVCPPARSSVRQLDMSKGDPVAASMCLSLRDRMLPPREMSGCAIATCRCVWVGLAVEGTWAPVRTTERKKVSGALAMLWLAKMIAT